MAYFFVELPTGSLNATRFDGVGTYLVEAANATEAKNMCRAEHSGDFGWEDATATQITGAFAADLLGWEYRVRVSLASGGEPDLVDVSGKVAAGQIGVTSITLGAGGTGYTVNDVLTVSGGTFTASARLKATTVAAGAVTAAVVIDPGLYTTLPTNPAAVTGGTGTGATFNLTGTSSLNNVVMCGVLTKKLQDTAPIAGATFEPASNLLTVAAASDNLGDRTLRVETFPPGAKELMPSSPLVGTIVHQGAVGAALTVVLPLPTPIPVVIRRLK